MKPKSIALLTAIFFISCEKNGKKKKETFPIKEQQTWQLAAKVKGLSQPEGITFDPARNVLFISNQNDKEAGFISKMSPDGKLIAKEWVNGLANPKGIEIVGNKLYVSDDGVLIEIAIDEAKIVNQYKAKDAKLLNDVTSDVNGTIYVSDMLASAIYKLDTLGNFTKWLEDPKLEFPNGLLVKDKDLYVAAWGEIPNEKPMEAQQGNVLKVSLSDKSITKVSTKKVGNLDGIQSYENGFLLSDWMNGAIYHFTNHTPHLLFTSSKGSGDIAYANEKIYIPMALEGEALIYHKK
ncbi:SMP-30/gluconolactonase/LRE family protein [Tenacibaculum maritimum]|uniref:SMP-30/gluconolactonase/LRE family protein n=1 Tax=Tenacibaculum maritimum TaxID=107401 RepID=UPI000408E56F|nr:hypothetical protein [Tenacibaculum maritimum]